MKHSLAKNSVYNIIYRLLNVLYPLISEAYISRVLLPEGVGKVALALTIATYFMTIAALGIPNYGVKAIGGVQNDYNERCKCFSELFIINLISSLACFCIYIIFIFIFPNIADSKILFIFSVMVLANIINIDWLYQGLEEYGYIATRSLIIKLLSLILLFSFVKEKEDCAIYALILCLATCGNYLLNILKAHKYVKITRHGINIKRHIKPVFFLLFSTCATEVYTLLDSTMVGTLRSETELGYYTNASRLVRTIFNVLTATCTVFLPRLSYYYSNRMKKEYDKLANLGIKIALYFSLPGMVGVFILSKPIIMILYGSAFEPSIYALRILSVLILVFSIAYTAGHIILISSNRESTILRATISGAVVNFALNILLISRIGYLGAAIASVVAELMVTIVLVVETRNVYQLTLSNKYIFSILISTLLMIIALTLIISFLSSDIMRLIFGVSIGAMVYVTSTFVLKNEIAMLLYNKINRRLKSQKK